MVPMLTYYVLAAAGGALAGRVRRNLPTSSGPVLTWNCPDGSAPDVNGFCYEQPSGGGDQYALSGATAQSGGRLRRLSRLRRNPTQPVDLCPPGSVWGPVSQRCIYFDPDPALAGDQYAQSGATAARRPVRPVSSHQRLVNLHNAGKEPSQGHVRLGSRRNPPTVPIPPITAEDFCWETPSGDIRCGTGTGPGSVPVTGAAGLAPANGGQLETPAPADLQCGPGATLEVRNGKWVCLARHMTDGRHDLDPVQAVSQYAPAGQQAQAAAAAPVRHQRLGGRRARRNKGHGDHQLLGLPRIERNPIDVAAMCPPGYIDLGGGACFLPSAAQSSRGGGRLGKLPRRSSRLASGIASLLRR